MVFCRLFNPMSGCRLPNRGRLWSPHWSCGKSGLSHVSATWGRFEEMGLYMGWYENRAPRIPIVSVFVFSQFKNVILGGIPNVQTHIIYIYILICILYIYMCLYYSLVMLNNYVFLHIYFSVCCIPGPSWTLKLPVSQHQLLMTSLSGQISKMYIPYCLEKPQNDCTIDKLRNISYPVLVFATLFLGA